MKKYFIAMLISVLTASCSSKLAFYNETPYSNVQGSVAEITETTYPARKAGQKVVVDKKTYQKFHYTFNKAGQFLTSRYWGKGPDAGAESKSTFKYKKGDMVHRMSEISYQGGSYTDNYKRIKQGKNSAVYHIFSNGRERMDTIFVDYNPKKNVAVEKVTDAFGKTFITTNTFNNHRKIESERFNGKKSDYKATYSYNDELLLIKETNKWNADKANTTTKKYTKYDTQGNWTECESYFNGELQSVTEREIVYK